MFTIRTLSDLCRRCAHEFRNTFVERYHPERHYMRGPGPACRRAALARSVH